VERAGNRQCSDSELSIFADHTSGLSPSWKLGRLFCSPSSKIILMKKFHIPSSQIVRTLQMFVCDRADHACVPEQEVLELNTPHLIYMDEEKRESFNVTLFDANHCPGAVLFLFEGYFGRILATGDFRYSGIW
jgi:DNA cross-link repair 1B protein